MALTDNINAYWKLDESSGNATDSTGNGNTATNIGTLTYGTGKINNGITNDGSAKYLSAADSATLSPTGDITISLWFKINNLLGANAAKPLICKGFEGNTQRSFVLYYSTFGGSNLTFNNSSTGSGGGSATVSWSPSTSTWYHISVVYTASAGSARFYVNGTQQGTTQTGLNTSLYDGNTAFLIGGDTFDYFDGVMDEVGFWSRALSAGEVSQLWNGGNGTQYPFTDVGIAFDNFTQGVNGSGTSLTFSHTTSGDNRSLVVYCIGATASDVITGVTYNSVSMSLVRKDAPSGDNDRWQYMFFLQNPASGANNVVVSASSTTFLLGAAASYTGTRQTDGIDNSASTVSGSSTTFSPSLTTIADNCWLIGYETGAGVSVGANTVQRSGAANPIIVDSNGAKSPAGSYALNYTASAKTWQGFIGSIAPVPAVTYNSAIARRALLTRM